jgi:hypothetical protein
VPVSARTRIAPRANFEQGLSLTHSTQIIDPGKKIQEAADGKRKGTMRETWLHTNVRAIAVALLLPVAGLCVGLALLLGPATTGLRVAGGVLLAGGLYLTAVLAGWLLTPRLAYRDGWLLVYLWGWRPERVPIDVVEAFFLGQGPSEVPLMGHREVAPQSRNIVVRLAEAAREYHARPARRALGRWGEGYITIRGAWCEPIGPEILRRLNERLVATHRARRARGAEVQT